MPKSSKPRAESLAKCPTGIRGLDEITCGGLPRGRTTLVCGGAGCGKTLLGLEFLVRGAIDYGEAGVCISFEETADELTKNVASLGFDLNDLTARGKLSIDHVFIERSLVEETGEYDLEALFVRLGYAVDSIRAKRVLIDSVEALFAGLQDESVLRSELRRLFRWLKERGLTAVVTGERGAGTLTRHGLEEYISDCVIVLDHRVTETVFTRRLRVVKYRGSLHGTNEYPFLIDQDGISVLPVTSLDLEHASSVEHVSSGVPALDAMLGGQGYFRGSSVLVSGTAGTGKTSLAAQFVAAGCARGERCLYFSFEESASQVTRNLRSVGIELGRWIAKGQLCFQASRPTTFGLEMHLVKIHKAVADFKPSLVVMDPVTALLKAGAPNETASMMLRVIDFLKAQQITTLFTALSRAGESLEITEVDISSLMDVWILLRDIESGGERNRGIYVLKARGAAHSNQIREFLLTSKGIHLRPVSLAAGELLTGSARRAFEAREASEALAARQDFERRQLTLARKRKELEAQIAALELETEALESTQLAAQEKTRSERSEQDLGEMTRSLSGKSSAAGPAGNSKPRAKRRPANER